MLSFFVILDFSFVMLTCTHLFAYMFPYVSCLLALISQNFRVLSTIDNILQSALFTMIWLWWKWPLYLISSRSYDNLYKEFATLPLFNGSSMFDWLPTMPWINVPWRLAEQTHFSFHLHEIAHCFVYNWIVIFFVGRANSYAFSTPCV